MKNINGRLYATENGIIYDSSTNYVFLPYQSGSVEEMCATMPEDLNKKALANAQLGQGSDFAVNLNLTSACNLSCTYCFAQGGDYGKAKDNMSVEILPILKNLIVNNVTSSRQVRFEYFGGEPLLNEEMIIALVDFAQKLEVETGIHVLHRISTNLTVLTPTILELLCNNDFVVSVSIDGKQCVQDEQRPSRNGLSTYDVILTNIKKIKDRNPDIRTVARMTIAQKNTTILENLRELVSTQLFNYASIYPASISPSKNTNSAYKFFFDDEIKRQYHELFLNYEYLFSLSNSFYGVLEFERILEQLLFGKVSFNHCSAGNNYCTLSSDSSVVTCHRLCGKKEYQLNHDETGKLDARLRTKWIKTADENDTCKRCFARYICGGGCKQENISFSGNINDKNPFACEYRRFLLEEILSNIETLTLSFSKRFHSLDNMFVYCGRPLLINCRPTFHETSKCKVYCAEELQWEQKNG